MSYCFNPHCPKPQNLPNTKFCINCGSKLFLNHRYLALKLIGQGGMGRTFLAEDWKKTSHPPCVIKQFYLQEQNQKKKAQELFQQEAKRLEQLGSHPQIPELYAYIEEDNRQYIVQEFIDGENLQQELQTNGVFSETNIRNLLQDLLPVLQFIHQGKVIHRDIKPENIIRRLSDTKLVLVDFGAAKFATATALAKTGTRIGSPEYVAPEQTRGKATFASDIYSLGATCLHLITQMSPFDLFDIHEDTWVWREYLVDNYISEELGFILDKMVENSLKKRWKNVEEILTFFQPTPILLTKNNTKEKFTFHYLYTLKGHGDEVSCLAFHPKGKFLASGSGNWDQTIKIWDWQTKKAVKILKGHIDGITCLAFSPDGEILASGSDFHDRSIKLWHGVTGEILATFVGHTNKVNSLVFTPDGQTLISCSQDGKIIFWDVTTRNLLSKIENDIDAVISLSISHDGEIMAAGMEDGCIKLYNLANKKLISTIKAHLWSVLSLAFSPDNRILASASEDATVKLWHSLSGKQLYSPGSEHKLAVTSVCFSVDGRAIIDGSRDGTLKLWYLNDQKKFSSQTLKAHAIAVNAVQFSPDGRIIASSSNDRTIKIWQVIH